MRELLICLLSILTFSAMAMDHQVMYITNDNDDEIVKFIVQTDPQNLEMQTLVKKTYDKHMNYLGREAYDAASVRRKGAVLTETDGRKVVVLKLTKAFSMTKGGAVILDYLYSGISGKRAKFLLSISKSKAGKWLASKNGKSFKHLFFKSNKKPLIGTIGIKNIIIK
jgi:hypothetical protein